MKIQLEIDIDKNSMSQYCSDCGTEYVPDFTTNRMGFACASCGGMTSPTGRINIKGRGSVTESVNGGEGGVLIPNVPINLYIG